MPRKKADTNNNSTASEPEAKSEKTASVTAENISKTVPAQRVFNESIRELVDEDDKSRNIKRPIHVRVAVRQGESIEQMLRRFNFAVTKSEVIQKMKDAQFFEKPSKRRQREEKMRLQQIRKYEG